jgi:hypothetical protein
VWAKSRPNPMKPRPKWSASPSGYHRQDGWSREMADCSRLDFARRLCGGRSGRLDRAWSAMGSENCWSDQASRQCPRSGWRVCRRGAGSTCNRRRLRLRLPGTLHPDAAERLPHAPAGHRVGLGRATRAAEHLARFGHTSKALAHRLAHKWGWRRDTRCPVLRARRPERLAAQVKP